MVRHHTKQHSHRKACEIDGPPLPVSDDAVLLVGFSNDEVVDRPSSQVAHDTVALVDALLCGAAIARHGHPARVGDDPVAIGLMANHACHYSQCNVVEGAYT